MRIPKLGYVGVGIVEKEAVRASEFILQDSGKPITESNTTGQYNLDLGSEKEEYFVKINWIKTVDRDKAVGRLGTFANQNSVGKPTTQKWVDTVQLLKKDWKIN